MQVPFSCRQPLATNTSEWLNYLDNLTHVANRKLDFCNAFWGLADGAVFAKHGKNGGGIEKLLEREVSLVVHFCHNQLKVVEFRGKNNWRRVRKEVGEGGCDETGCASLFSWLSEKLNCGDECVLPRITIHIHNSTLRFLFWLVGCTELNFPFESGSTNLHRARSPPSHIPFMTTYQVSIENWRILTVAFEEHRLEFMKDDLWACANAQVVSTVCHRWWGYVSTVVAC